MWATGHLVAVAGTVEVLLRPGTGKAREEVRSKVPITKTVFDFCDEA